MRKFFIYFILTFIFSSCSYTVYHVPTNMTAKGRENYLESNKRIKKENKAIKKHHKKERKRIKKLQSIRLK